MKDRIIYYTNGKTTVCLLRENDNIVARGISVCSRLDIFNRGEGKRHARNRAFEARGRQRDCAEIKLGTPRSMWFDVVHLSLARDCFGDYKGYYMPKLTPTEETILELKR